MADDNPTQPGTPNEAAVQPLPSAAAKPAEPPRKIAILGEIPFTGRALVKALLDRGLSARVLCSDEQAERAVAELRPAGGESVVEVVRGSLESPQAIAEAMQGVYAAVLLSPVTMGGRTYRAQSHLDDVRRFIQASETAAIRKLVYQSQLGAYKNSLSRALREASQAEQLIHESRCEDFCVRTGPIMGPDDGFLSEIVSAARKSAPVMGVLGYGSTMVQPIHVDDFARCMTRFFFDQPEELRPDVYAVAGPEITTLLDLTDMALEKAGRFKFKFHAPLFIMKLVVSLKPGGALEEKVGLLFDVFCTDRNDAANLMGPGTTLKTPRQTQEEILAST
jgi:uncharacterized protein YbjT (DUF2867 family)